MKARFYAWLIASALLLALFGLQVWPRIQFETDLFALLPTDRQDPQASQALRRFGESFGRNTVFLVGAPDFAQARAAAARMDAALEKSGAFEHVQFKLQGDLAGLRDALAAHRWNVLSQQHRAWLEAGNTAPLEQEAMAAAYSPLVLARPYGLMEDPLGLSSAYLMGLFAGSGNAAPRDDVLAVSAGGRDYVLLIARTRGSPFSGAVQDELGPALDAALAAARSDPGVDVLISGVAPHAVAAARTAKTEMSMFGTISSVGVLLLLLITFRSWRPLVFSAASMALGAVAGITACYYIFGKMHVLTLVLSSSLVGVADYSLHYFADQFRDPRGWTPEGGLQHVAPSVLFGLVTAILGYGSFMLTPLPGLQQLAVFSAAALAAACGSVLCMYPPLTGSVRPRHQPLTLALARRVSETRGRLRRVPPLLLVFLAAVCAAGLWRLQFADDVRLLQSSPPQLIEQEKKVREILGTDIDSRFFLVRGADAQAVLQREEQLRARLDPLIAQGEVGAYRALSQALPSLQRQQRDHALLARQVYADQGLLPRFATQLGLDRSYVEKQQRSFNQTAPSWTLENWLASPAATASAGLWLGPLGDDQASVVTLSGVKSPEALAAATPGMAGVKLVDNVADVSRLLQEYRRSAMRALTVVYLMVALMLWWRYGARSALALLAVPVGASLTTLALFGLLGLSVNLLNVLGLLLLLGVGVDYAVFLRESRTAQASAMLAVLLSAISTVLAFGMLGFSATPFIRSLGLTLLMGISLSFAYAWLASPPAASDHVSSP